MTIHDWVLNDIRNNINLSWLESHSFVWSNMLLKVISHVIEGGTLLFYTDNARYWLDVYISSKINMGIRNRPLVSIFRLDSSLLSLAKMNNFDELDFILDISYKNFAIWYIGHSDEAKFALYYQNSFIWPINNFEQGHINFLFDDKELDFKLLNLYNSFENALFAGICQEFYIS